MFADDAYNKYVNEGPGTLVGNWFEERSIRDVTGEGRTVPQRHIPRSGLLKDFTRTPHGGPRKMDDTFERCYGPKVFPRDVPMSKTIGAGEEDLTGEKRIVELLQAEGRVQRLGERERLAHTARMEAAEQHVQLEEAARAEVANRRHFDTTTGVHFQKPDLTRTEKPGFLRKSYKLELMHGPAPDRSRALLNAGLEVQTNVHYSNAEPVTHMRMSMADARARNDLKVSAASGVSAFGRNSDFSKPINEFMKGLCKDDEMDTVYQGLKGTNPHRTLSGTKPLASAFASVPSLTVLKESIHYRVADTWGAHGYVSLRQRLCDRADHEGFISHSEAVDVFRHDLGLTEDDVSPAALDVYLQQKTMRKHEIRVSALMSSLRPSLPQMTKKTVLHAFDALGPVGGAVVLGHWLSRVQDEALRGVLVQAFGGSTEEDVERTLVAEDAFVELLSDLAALTDVEPLMA